jgi:hypothetical protein
MQLTVNYFDTLAPNSVYTAFRRSGAWLQDDDSTKPFHTFGPDGPACENLLRRELDAWEAWKREQDDCPGAGRCHGAMKDCPWCGDVGRLCDQASCDTHFPLKF